MELSEHLSNVQNNGGNILSELEKELENRIQNENKNTEVVEKKEVQKKEEEGNEERREEVVKSQKAPVGAPANCEEYFYLVRSNFSFQNIILMFF